MPSGTPVCFGAIVSGASPEVHGIKEYARPILTIETVFDTFPEAGRKACIISRDQCSMDMIFRRRNVDYLAFNSDERAFRATELAMELGDYDLIVSYMMDYDELAHHTGIDSPDAAAQVALASDRFERLCALADSLWKARNRVVVYAPDHGQHAIDDHHGGHGMNLPEDMIVNHYYRVCGKNSQIDN
jgi:predicted AlkP superfamily pyrophosphatase or phosphodiesterase